VQHEINDFLEASKFSVHLGAVNKKGDANIYPAWYLYDSSNNNIYVEGSKQGKKSYNLRKSENVYFCIDDPNPPCKGVRGNGRVKIHQDIDFNFHIAEKIMVKYLGSLEHPVAKTLIDMQKKGQSVILEISPKYYSTWDYGKH
jgi:general stress protein 26